MNHATLTNTRRVLAVAVTLACPLIYAGTEGYITTSTAAGTSEIGPEAVFSDGDPVQSSIVSREMARREADRNMAMQLLQEGRTAYANKKYSDALEKYRKAWDVLPKGRNTANLQKFLRESISDASIAVAMEEAKVGRYDDAEQLLLDVLQRDPGNARAAKELARLRDPIRNNPALTPEHVKNVDEVNRLLALAWGYYDLGQFDQAIKEFDAVLRIDPYNEAARRGQEECIKRQQRYYESARNEARAIALRQVDETWETKVPDLLEHENFGSPGNSTKRVPTEKEVRIEQALDQVHIAKVNFDKTLISDVVEFLLGELRKNNQTFVNINYIAPKPNALAAAKATAAKASSEEEDTDEEDEDVDPGDEDTDEDAPAPAPAAVAATPPPEPEVTVRLSDVTLREVLQEVCSSANCSFLVTERGVNIYMADDPNSKPLERRTWTVSPSFFLGEGEGEEETDSSGDADEDPFSTTAKSKKIDAKAALRTAGAALNADGSSVSYNKKLGKLTVVSTVDDLDAIEEAIFDYNSKKPRMVKVTTKFVEVTQKNDEELSFDWVVNPFSISSNGSAYLGGVNGYSSSPNRTYQDFVTNEDAGSAFGNKYNGGGSWPVHNNNQLASRDDTITNGLATGGLRTGSGAITANNLDSLLASGDTSSTAAQNARPAPGILSLAGIYDSGSFEMIMRGLSQKQGVDVMNAPSLVITPELTPGPSPEDGALASPIEDDESSRIDVVRRFIYPTAFDPPTIPENNWGNNNNNGNNGGGASVPVAAPSNPSEWATEEVGLSMVVKINTNLADNIIRFDRFLVRVVDFEGFVNYGSPIISGVTTANLIETIVLTENRIDVPVFSRKMVNTSLALYDGYTVAIGGMIEDKVQKVEDKVPVFGDLPLIGRFFRSNAESHTRKNLTIFVTGDIIDPTGRPVRSLGEDRTPSNSADAPGLFPMDGLTTP